MIDIWAIAGFLGAGIAAITVAAFVAKWLGHSEFITAISTTLNFIWSIVRGGFEFLNSMPTPLRVVFFLLMFSVIGGLIYTVTFGLTHVCGEDGKVYITDPFTGFAFQYWPTYSGPPAEPESVSTDLIDLGNIMYSGNEVYQGIQYNVTYIKAPINGLRFKLIPTSGPLILKPAREQWSDVTYGLLSDDQYYRVAICIDPETNVCVAFREGLGAQPFYLGGVWNGCQSPFSATVGKLEYYWGEDMNELSITYSPSHGLLTGVANPEISDCVTYTGEVTSDMGMLAYDPEMLNFKYEIGGVLGVDVDVVDKPVYNMMDGEIRVSRADGSLFTSVGGEDRRRMIEQMGVYNYSSNEVFKFVCDESTVDNPNDTEMRVMGFNPFDITTLMLFMFIVFLVYIIFRRR